MKTGTYLTTFPRLLLGLLFLTTALALPASSWAYSRSMKIDQTSTGQNMTFDFTSLPRGTGNITVTVHVYGDYNATSEYADVWLDNVAQSPDVCATGCTQCSTSGHTQNYTISTSTINSDRRLIVRVDLSTGVNLLCGSTVAERVEVTLNYASRDLRMYSWSFTQT